ncbi:SURF1 family protein [Halomonas sp. Bachu 37]|uniref:SURF1 family protein n=1 Tax=Halomonas kashgarensis TaxID=3084920 RepID=UPI003216704E
MENSSQGAVQVRRDRWRLIGWYGFWMVLVILGIALGLWQWERAADKQALLEQRQTAPVMLNPAEPPVPGAKVTLTGHYLAEHTRFLDNRTLNGRLGVAALTPLKDSKGRMWLVERGFLPTGPSRDTPNVETPSDQVEVTGEWQAAGDQGLLLGPNSEGLRLQQIQLQEWAEVGEFAYSGWLHLEAGEGALEPWWEANVMPPSRHLGYAVQWWGLALAAFVVMMLGARRLRYDNQQWNGGST